MRRDLRALTTVAWVALAVLLYFLITYPFLPDVLPDSSAAVVISAFVAAHLLVAAWGWLMARTTRGGTWKKRSHRLPVVIVLGLLAVLAAIPGLSALGVGALFLTVPITLIGITRVWKWGIVLFVWPLLSSEFYFGAVLLLIGVIRLPPRAGSYLRELFPRRVGESS